MNRAGYFNYFADFAAFLWHQFQALGTGYFCGYFTDVHDGNGYFTDVHDGTGYFCVQAAYFLWHQFQRHLVPPVHSTDVGCVGGHTRMYMYCWFPFL